MRSCSTYYLCIAQFNKELSQAEVVIFEKNISPVPIRQEKCKFQCEKNCILLIVDEAQAGLGQTGRLLFCHHDNVN